MRLQLLMPKEIKAVKANADVLAVLSECLANKGIVGEDVILTDENPDIIHAFGSWNAHVRSIIELSYKKHIPIVLSPLSGLQPWNMRSKAMGAREERQSVRRASAVHAFNKMELTKLQKLSWNNNVFLVRSCVTTNRVSAEEMTKGLFEQYRHIIDLHDQQERDNIKARIEGAGCNDSAMKQIATILLYTHYHYVRGGIPQRLLYDLSQQLTGLNYNEDDFCALLVSLGIADFASSLFQVASEKSTLTEGFMPLPATDNKLTRQIREMITDY